MKKTYQRRSHLELRGTTWYVRWDVPHDVRHAFENKRVMKRALDTDKHEAKRKSMELLYQWQSTAQKVRAGDFDPTTLLETKLKDFKARSIAREEINDMTALKRAGPVVKMLNDPKRLEKTIEKWELIHQAVATPGHEDSLFAFIEGSENILECLTSQRNKLSDKTDAYKYLTLIESLRQESDIMQIYAETNIGLSFKELKELVNRLEVSSEKIPAHGISDSLLNDWHRSMTDQYKSSKTISDYYSKVKKFQTYLNKNKLPLTFLTVSEFKNSVSQKKQTQSSYVGAVRNFWQWSIKYKPEFISMYRGSADPTAGHQYPKYGENKGESYIAFTKSEVNTLFNYCLQVETQDLELACLIAYGVMTGARIEEIGRINAKNTKFIDSTPASFKIYESKTNSGIREVPLHLALQPLHSVLLTRKNSENSIFSIKKTKRDTQLDHLSKRFGRLKNKLGFGKLQVFHSLRKTFTTELYEKKVAHELIQRLVGHIGDNITTSIYLDDFSLSRKIEAINSVDIELDISQLIKLTEAQN